MTPYELHTRLTQLRLTSCQYANFTSSHARVAIKGYEGVIAGRHQGRPVTLEGAFEVVYGEPMHPKAKVRRRA
jgi:hypothetical protein